MSRIEALKELAAKVGAGDKHYHPTKDFHLAMGGKPYDSPGKTSGALEADRAYHGSIDAAIELMGAVLPGWLWVCGTDSDGPFSYVNEFPGEEMEMAVGDETRCADVARSLLLAILRALIAKEGE